MTPPFPNFDLALKIAAEKGDSDPVVAKSLIAMVSATISDCAYRGLTLSEADTALNVRVRSVFKHAIAWRFVGLSCHVPAQVRGSTFLKGRHRGIEPWLEKIFRKEM